MNYWRTLGFIFLCWGCGDEQRPSRPLPVDTFDGSLFDARRPFDPVTSENGSGYGASLGSGANDGYGASGVPSMPQSDDEDTPEEVMVDDTPDMGVETLDGGLSVDADTTDVRPATDAEIIDPAG